MDGPATSAAEKARLNRNLIHRKRKRQQELATQRKKQRTRGSCIRLDTSVDGADAIARLRDFEQRLDTFFLRRRMDMHNALRAQPVARHRGTMLVSISSTTSGRDQTSSGASEPTWTLKVEGEPIVKDAASGKAPSKYKFGKFVKRVFVELDPRIYPTDNTIEWKKSSQQDEGKDGFQISRPGTKDVEVKIFLHVENLPERYKLTSSLSKLLGTHTDTRVNLIHSLWRYIKDGGLQDRDDPKLIHCDTALQQVLNREHLVFSDLPVVIGEHLQAPDPIALSYTVKMNPEEANTETHEITVDIEDAQLRMDAARFLMATSTTKKIQTLNMEINDLATDINDRNRNKLFLSGFVENPVAFVNRWEQSQQADASLILDGRCTSSRATKQPASFYASPWAEEGARRYLSEKIAKRRIEVGEALRQMSKKSN